jgi:hypothetical protein
MRWAARIVLAGIGWIAAGGLAVALDQGWPREFEHSNAKVVVYQPQFDSYEGTRVKGRSAVAITRAGAKKPVFGAVWFEATADIDRDERVVDFREITVPRVRFPDATPEVEAALTKVLEEAMPRWDNQLSYDRFVAAVAAIAGEHEAAANLRHDPPRIVFEREPALLLLYDGTPQLRDIPETKLRRIINTPSVVVLDPAVGRHFLYGGAGWFEAADALGPWKPTAKPTAEVAAVVADLEKRAAELAKKNGEIPPQDDERELAAEARKENPELADAPPPKIVVATEPTELVVFEGEPEYAPLMEGEILYVKNTASDVLLEVATQHHFVLLSGRWYRSAGLTAMPWEFVRPDQLPPSFKGIPEESPKGHVLAAVAGTPQAEEALADAQIPQVAEVRRGEAKLDLQYDGEPQFEKIPNTAIEYAKNTPHQVLRTEGKYYACESGIWYVSSAPDGPWQVADSVPPEVEAIPPESPVYNVKYVEVYDSTPEVVYVGYTQPYLGYYPYYGTVVWGTGYPYVPWMGSVYYPHPMTWGFHAGYSPYGGWSFGVSMGWAYGWGAISIGFCWGWGWGGHPYYPPYWGMGGFYPVYRPPYHPPHYPPYNPGRPGGGYPGAGTGNRPSTLPSQQPTRPAGRPSNIYERPANHDRVASTPERARPELATRPSKNEANNVFADEAGNVYRRGQGGKWEQRVGDSWKSAPKGGSRPSTTPAGAKPSQPMASPPSQSVNRDAAARQRGSTRASTYGSYGGYRGGSGGYRGGGMRGGGGRR